MWKSGKSLRGEREISPQPSVRKRRDFHRACWEKSGKEIIHRKNSTFHSPCGKNLVSKKTRYRQELMFAVMSRMLFCILLSPFFRDTSTLRMA